MSVVVSSPATSTPEPKSTLNPEPQTLNRSHQNSSKVRCSARAGMGRLRRLPVRARLGVLGFRILTLKTYTLNPES